LIGAEIGFAQTVASGMERKSVIVLDPAESFLLSGRNNLTIDDQTRSRIMIER
jgi:hypothetical protein